MRSTKRIKYFERRKWEARIPIPTLSGIKTFLEENVCFVAKHPLDYGTGDAMYDLKDVPKDLKEGRVRLVNKEELYLWLISELERYEPRLVSLIKCYKEFAERGKLDLSLLNRALEDFYGLIVEEAKVNKDKAQELFLIIKEIDLSDVERKGILFDKLVHMLHFNPDFLRHLKSPVREYVCSLVVFFLDVLRYGDELKTLRMWERYGVVTNTKWFLKWLREKEKLSHKNKEEVLYEISSDTNERSL